jgi:hypothetical protein
MPKSTVQKLEEILISLLRCSRLGCLWRASMLGTNAQHQNDSITNSVQTIKQFPLNYHNFLFQFFRIAWFSPSPARLEVMAWVLARLAPSFYMSRSSRWASIFFSPIRPKCRSLLPVWSTEIETKTCLYFCFRTGKPVANSNSFFRSWDRLLGHGTSLQWARMFLDDTHPFLWKCSSSICLDHSF